MKDLERFLRESTGIGSEAPWQLTEPADPDSLIGTDGEEEQVG